MFKKYILVLSTLLLSYCCYAQTENVEIIWESTDTNFQRLFAFFEVEKDSLFEIILLGKEGKLQQYRLSPKTGVDKKTKQLIALDFVPMCLTYLNKNELLYVGKKDSIIVIEQQTLNDVKKKITYSLSDTIKGEFVAIQRLKNGDYLLAGKTAKSPTDMQLLRLGADGKLKWHQTFGSRMGTDGVLAIHEDKKGDLYYTGYTNDFGDREYFAFVGKLDATGRNIWEKTYGDFGHKTYGIAILTNEEELPIFVLSKKDKLDLVALKSTRDILWRKEIFHPEKGLLKIDGKYLILLNRIE